MGEAGFLTTEAHHGGTENTKIILFCGALTCVGAVFKLR